MLRRKSSPDAPVKSDALLQHVAGPSPLAKPFSLGEAGEHHYVRLHSASGCMVGAEFKAAPSPLGRQASMIAPLGNERTPCAPAKPRRREKRRPRQHGFQQRQTHRAADALENRSPIQSARSWCCSFAFRSNRNGALFDDCRHQG